MCSDRVKCGKVYSMADIAAGDLRLCPGTFFIRAVEHTCNLPLAPWHAIKRTFVLPSADRQYPVFSLRQWFKILAGNQGGMAQFAELCNHWKAGCSANGQLPDLHQGIFFFLNH